MDDMPVRSARIFACAALFFFSSSASAAESTVAKSDTKPAAKTVAKPAKSSARQSVKQGRKAAAKPAPKLTGAALKPHAQHAPKASAPLRGPTETLTCRNGTEDRHARIGVVLIGGKVDSFAYYSKWKPRTCSIYLQRSRDPYSRWSDQGKVTTVNLERGLFTIEQSKKGEYRFVFRDIDRERYCGMDGTINGTLTIRKGSESCEVVGVMEEGVPLGQAYAHLQQGEGAPAAVYGYGTATAAPPRPQTAPPPSRLTSGHAWPAPTVGLSD
jgi:hypothetical protein